MLVEDKPGVLSSVTQILSDSSISIEAMMQKKPVADEAHVPVIILTNTVIEGNMNRAIDQIESLVSVKANVVRIRVESLG